MAAEEESNEPSRAIAHAAEPLRPALARYFRARVRDSAEVDDLVQDVFARIVARKGSQPIDHVGGYVFQTAASVLADRARRRGARQADVHVQFDPDRHADEDIDPHRHLSGREDLRAALDALLALPDRTRTVFILHRLEGQKYRDVAAQLSISVSAVEKHMVRAIQHLAATLGARS